MELKPHSSIPGPRNSLFASIVAVIKIALRPYVALQNFRKKFGDPFHVWMVGMGHVVATGRPDLIKTIFSLRPEKFTLMMTPMLIHLFGPRSLFTSEGETHATDKRLVFPHFKGERMRAYGPTMANCAIAQCDQHAGGKKVCFMDMAREITLEVMIRSQLGVTETAKINEMKVLLHKLNSSQNPLIGYKFFRRNFFGLGPWAKFQRYNIPIRAYILELIREYRTQEKKGEDILSLLAETTYEDGTSLAEEHISDHIFSILLAGYDTTANSITWGLDVMLRHPETLKKIREEIDALGPDASPHALSQLPWLDAACYEILRLYPPIESLPVRELLEDFELDGYKIPKGYGLCPIPTLAHRDPELYPDPDDFKPERFLGKKPQNFAYLPFGGGARLCIGFAFANYQMRVVIGTCIQKYHFELLDPLPIPKRHSVTIGPKGSSRALITKRK